MGIEILPENANASNLTSPKHLVKPVVKRIEDVRGIDGVLISMDKTYLERETTKEDIPYNWYEGMSFDRQAGYDRWIDSLKWRRGGDIDNILKRKQPKFQKIKDSWDHYFLGVNENGYLVTLERFHSVEGICKNLKNAEVSPEEFRDHCVFLNEYWIQNRLAYKGKILKIIDVNGLSVGWNISMIVKYFGKMNEALQKYPEILEESYFVNVHKAGTAFRFFFKLLPKFVEKRTMQKIHTVPQGEEGVRQLLNFIDGDLLPKDLGGNFEGDLAQLPLEKVINDFVQSL